MPFCVYCGSQEPAEAVFCSKCRQPLNRNDPTRIVNKPRAVHHQELISQSEEQASVLLTRQNVAPHAHDPSGYSGQQKRTRERDKHHRALHHGWTLTITLILIVALVVAAIVGALKFVSSIFHLGSNSPRQMTVTTYEVPGDSWDITAGPDGNLWFTEFGSGKIGRISPGGKATEFPLSATNYGLDSMPITAGPDGNLWFTEDAVYSSEADGGNKISGSKIERITPAGQITKFPLPTTISSLDGITVGPDGNLWLAGQTSKGKGVIVRVAL